MGYIFRIRHDGVEFLNKAVTFQDASILEKYIIEL